MPNIDKTKEDKKLRASDYPSKVTEIPFVYADVKVHKRQVKTSEISNGGKWCIFPQQERGMEIKQYDDLWQSIKKATEMGFLGTGSKAATCNPTQVKKDKILGPMICVYTYNWKDEKDVMRVKNELRKIGITQTLHYKADIDTGVKYRRNGDKHISKYIDKAVKNINQSDLFSIYGIGYDKVKLLNQNGVNSIKDLIAFDTSKKLEGVGITPDYIKKLQRFAYSKLNNKILKLTEFEFPNDIFYFDIETDITDNHKDKRIWSIITSYKNEVRHFYAKSWDDEKHILTEFLKHIKLNRDKALFSFSSFDVSVLIFAFKRHKLDHVFFAKCNHHDLFANITQHYVLPISSYGLKEIGKYLGYKFANENMSGKNVAIKYLGLQGTGKKLPKNILDYIHDDVKSMDYIITQLKTKKDIEQIS